MCNPIEVPKLLTDRQRSILDFIGSSIRYEGGAPSYREIAVHFDITVGGLQKQLKALETKGVLLRGAVRTARALRVIAKQGAADQDRLPILGQVRAGTPVEAIETVEDHLLLDRTFTKGAEYVLRAKGDSMVPEILEDDLLLVRRVSDADNGTTVVAYIDAGDATVKRFRKANGKVWLQAVNPKYPRIRSESLKVIGLVVGLIRTLQ